MSYLHSLPPNTQGRDFFVGDIHGHFSKLDRALARVKFNAGADRLIAAGDLVDRGPESCSALNWLREPWFFSVLGNHEWACCASLTGDLSPAMHRDWGGDWFHALPIGDQYAIASIFMKLPYAIEVPTSAGVVGVVHADCLFPTWEEFTSQLSSENPSELMSTIWGRERINRPQRFPAVKGVRAVVCGHTPVPVVTSQQNVLFIDTGAWQKLGGEFTLINAHTLEAE